MTKTIATLVHPYSLAARRLIATAATVGLLVASGCGDDSTSDEGAGTGSTTETPAPSTGTEPATGDSTDGPPPGSSDDGSTGADSTTDTPADSSSDSTGAAGLEIVGTWFEDLGGGTTVDHVIDEATWAQNASFGDSLFHIDSYDNAGMWVVAQGDATNEFFPELYSKFNWTWDGADLYYCTSVFDAATAEDAIAAPDADAGDLATGCGGFPWSLLMPAA